MKKSILYVHHDHGNSGASRSLSFLLDKINPYEYSAKVHCIFGGPVLKLYKERPVDILYDKGIYSFHGSTVTGVSLDRLLRNFKRLPQSVTAAYRIVKKNKPDLVHLNSSCLFAVALATKLLDRKIKVICHVREPLLNHSLSASIMRYMNYFFVDHFIAIDSYSGSTMKTKNNLSVIYNAVNFNQYNPAIQSNILREEFNLHKEDIIFLYLARIAKSNGTLEFVKTAQKLQKDYPHFHFVIAGVNENTNDGYSKRVISLAETLKNIHLMKFRDDVPLLIASSDIMVVPFTEPHFARSIVEASAMSKPTIGANVGGVNELVMHNNTGLLYNNKYEFINHCIKLGTNSSLRHEMGEKALNYAIQNFNNDESSRRVFEIYKSLLL